MIAPPAVTPQIWIVKVLGHAVQKRRKIIGTHGSKVTGEHIKGHDRSSLGDWNGCKDREDDGNVDHPDTTADNKLEAYTLGNIAVRAQGRQKTGTDDDEHPADAYRDQILACLPDRNSRHERDQADAVR